MSKPTPLPDNQVADAYARIAAGETVTAVAKSFNISRPQLWAELNETPVRRAAYARARLECGHAIAEKGYEAAIAEDKPSHERLARLKFDSSKWLASMVNLAYRDRVIQDHEGEIVIKLVDETRRELVVEAEDAELLPADTEPTPQLEAGPEPVE